MLARKVAAHATGERNLISCCFVSGSVGVAATAHRAPASAGGVEEQIYGDLMWGLGHALFYRLDIKRGRVVQSNFHDYRVARMSDMPAVDILVVDGEPRKPGGVGELGSPSVAPAIANALG